MRREAMSNRPKPDRNEPPVQDEEARQRAAHRRKGIALATALAVALSGVRQAQPRSSPST